jgi:signal transduction histidine kinase
MPKQRKHRFLTSVFTKLLVVILMAGLGINLALVILFGAFRQHIASNYQPHLTRYVGYLVKELGSPPDPERARRIASETHMVITYETPAVSWTTAEHPPDLPFGRFRLRHQGDNISVSSYHGAYRIVLRHGDGRLTFLLPHQADVEKKLHVLGAGLLLYVIFLMILAYLAIRRILKPLRWLRQGVARVGRGELSHQVPAGKSDELGDLATAFNTMTDRIRKLITSKEQLLLDISHELRTPVTRMKVALAMMADSSGKQNLEEDLAEMDRKITELLETARAVNVKANLNLQDTDLMRLIKETATGFEGVDPGIQIKDHAAVVRLDLDGRQMSRAVKNIIDNALKYSPRSGGPVEVSLNCEDARAIIVVRDHGIGIPEEDLPFVFEPFYRVDKSRTPRTGGYGLGLSLAKTIVEAHGGSIAITSKPDLGTTVRIYLLKPDSSPGR